MAAVGTKGVGLQTLRGVTGSALAIRAFANQTKEKQVAAEREKLKQKAREKDRELQEQLAAVKRSQEELDAMSDENKRLEKEVTGALGKIFDPSKAVATAEEVASLPLQERIGQFSGLEPHEQAQLLAHLGPESQSKLLDGMPDDVLLNIPLVADSGLSSLARERELWENEAHAKDCLLYTSPSPRDS
eukprot:TRINITY_DN25257_c0_g1_i1.p1 TRINITY_DN25257_c0_g1~~TRINITY_DN25257_c0_g1_i1.p1  ORF type:complete len:188 (+),score=60.44 TRINITY_DN25257_c0_g1_i1:139-702(+)